MADDAGQSADQSNEDVIRGASRVVEIVGEWYLERSGVRALVSVIPGVGGALDNLIAGEGARIQQQRLMKLIEDLRLDMAMIETGKLDADYL